MQIEYCQTSRNENSFYLDKQSYMLYDNNRTLHKQLSSLSNIKISVAF